MCGRVRVSVSCCCTILLQKVWTHRYVRTYHFMRHRSHWEAGEGEWQPTFHTPHAWTGVSRCPILQELLSSRFVLDHLSCAVRFRSGHAWYMGKGHDAVVGAAPPTHCSMSHLCVPSSSLHPAYCARRSKLKHSQSSQRYPASWQEPGSSFLVSALLLR